MLSGLAVFFPMRLKKFIQPIFSKFFHNLFAITAFVFGMISIIIAYYTRQPTNNVDMGKADFVIAGFVTVTLILTLIGPLKSLVRHGKTVLESIKNGNKFWAERDGNKS